MAEPLRLMIWTPSETLLDAEQVAWVHVELAEVGGLTIWPGHLPLLAETAVTTGVRYADREGTHVLDLPSGIIQVHDHTVTLFLAGSLGEQSVMQADRPLGFDRLFQTLLQDMH